jgi:hypothetical protein
MEFNATLLMLSLIPSGIGFVLFTYGRKTQRWPHLASGILFMIYPYFAPTVGTMVGGGLFLGIALYVVVAAGW